jgi:hypothetical protein
VGQRVESFADLVALPDDAPLDVMVPGAVAGGTKDAFRRRLHMATQHLGHLVRGDTAVRAGFPIDWEARQVTVVDIHTLHSTAQMFVVGVLLKRMMELKEARGTSHPLVFVVLDELNKYAPREGWSPIRGVLLDIAERGRSLGVSLFGAQQTASEVERRMVANAALKVVGRLDAAAAERAEYGFLTNRTRRVRATMLQPGQRSSSPTVVPACREPSRLLGARVRHVVSCPGLPRAPIIVVSRGCCSRPLSCRCLRRILPRRRKGRRLARPGIAQEAEEPDFGDQPAKATGTAAEAAASHRRGEGRRAWAR